MAGFLPFAMKCGFHCLVAGLFLLSTDYADFHRLENKSLKTIRANLCNLWTVDCGMVCFLIAETRKGGNAEKKG
jgi:hypothetical protein